jgi:ABC-type spermidine/putrescine transport system permease subunit I
MPPLTTSSFLSFLILLLADFIITKLLGTPKDTMLAQVRMCLVTAIFSSFVNDTPVVSERQRV